MFTIYFICKYFIIFIKWLSEKKQIKQKAQELGMKPADESQIVYYEIEHKNYMNQYEDVE